MGTVCAYMEGMNVGGCSVVVVVVVVVVGSGTGVWPNKGTAPYQRAYSRFALLSVNQLGVRVSFPSYSKGKR